MDPIIIPIVLFSIFPIIIWLVTSNRRKAQEAMAEVMSKMVEKGEVPSVELIRAMGVRPSRPHADLRTGLILIAIALATIFLGSVIPDKDADKALLGLAMFPLFVGFVYTGLWIFIGRKTPLN